MDRRTFLATGLAGAAASLEAVSTGRAQRGSVSQSSGRRAFKLKYAPHFGMFKHHAGDDLIDQLKFMADQGFTALEDNGMMGRPTEVQEKVSREMGRLGMTMGVFVAYAEWREPKMVHNKKDIRDMLVKQMRHAVEVAKRVNAKWCTVVPGPYDARLAWDYQTANLIDNLKACAEVCEPAGLVMVLEPLNFRDHPGLFLTKIPQAYQICRAVGSPSCKILNDLYHQQITEGNLIPNIDRAWSEIAYFQVGDNPGRKEPTTGEISYRNIFRHIHAKGYEGIIGMEHGNSKSGKEGEQAVIEAYAGCDDF
ncbi:MAG: hydroxypyruvate isomerase family protein [Phycisphaerae bacterium]